MTLDTTSVCYNVGRTVEKDMARCKARTRRRRTTMVDRRHVCLAHAAVASVDERHIPGDIVEVGVWRGGASCVLAAAHNRWRAPSRYLWLFDTFDGLPFPNVTVDGTRAVQLYRRARNVSGSAFFGADDGKMNYAPLRLVKQTMLLSGYDRVHYVVGKVEETLATAPVPKRISLLRLDTDWYSSTKVELDVLWERLSPGGWMTVDDYYQWRGSRRAVDEWLDGHNWTTKAHDVGAFLRRPSMCPAFPFSCNGVWKASPFSEATPFMLPPPVGGSSR